MPLPIPTLQLALGDAIKAIDTSVIEVHISNTFAREDFSSYFLHYTQRQGIDFRLWFSFLPFSRGEFSQCLIHILARLPVLALDPDFQK